MALRAPSRWISRAIYTSQPMLAQRTLFTATPSRHIDPIEGATELAARLATGIVVDDVANAFPSSSSNSESKPSSNSKASATSATTTTSSSLLPYHVSRTPSNQLPVYHDTRNGNTRKETIIRKISGDPRPLRDAIRELLGVDSDRVWIGKITGHVYVKGHHKVKIGKFLAENGF